MTESTSNSGRNVRWFADLGLGDVEQPQRLTPTIDVDRNPTPHIGPAARTTSDTGSELLQLTT